MSTGTLEAAPQLIADIGGTHARFALCTSVRDISHVSVVPVADYATIVDAITHYLDGLGKPSVRNAAIGIANPVMGDHIQMTNFPWEFSIESTRRTLQLEHLHVLNDFTVLALSLPHLDAQNLMPVGGGAGVPGTPLGVLGPGTGLGVSALIPTPSGGWIPLAAEGGHVSFAPADERESMLWHAAKKRYGHVSMERLLSGHGLEFIYSNLCRHHDLEARFTQAADIGRHGLDGTDEPSRWTLDTFCAILGTAASDLAVTLGARGGIYIGGGIVPRLGSYFLQSPFRQRFEDKGRFDSYLAAIPVFVIADNNPALLGAAAYLEAYPLA